MNWFGRSLASGCMAVLAGLTLLSALAQAQSYPTRSITMIVPFAAGGPTDVIAVSYTHLTLPTIYSV